MQAISRYKAMFLIKRAESTLGTASDTGDYVLDRIRNQQIEDENWRMFVLDVRTISGAEMMVDKESNEVMQFLLHTQDNTFAIEVEPCEFQDLMDMWERVTERKVARKKVVTKK